MKDKDTLTVVVNGKPVEVDVNDHAPLRTVIPKALEKSENIGQPPENWELRDAAGTELNLDRKIGDYGFTDETRLFLNLKAGIGG